MNTFLILNSETCPRRSIQFHAQVKRAAFTLHKLQPTRKKNRSKTLPLMEKKSIAIVGAGVSGLTACKHLLEKGFNPLVFESGEEIGGVWAHTIESTKLQTPKEAFRFTDFSWPEQVKEIYPDHRQVMDYLRSFAEKFDLLKYIKFKSKVEGVEFVGYDEDDVFGWENWNGNGEGFGKGKWRVVVTHEHSPGTTTQVYEMDFVILCIGRYSGAPYIPTFPENKGPEVFEGKVIHSMDYSNMDSDNVTELIKSKQVTVIGSLKSAVDITAECTNVNGIAYPCTMIFRNPHWLVDNYVVWGLPLGYLYFSRFYELLVHKPGEGFLLGAISTLLLPLRWALSKFAEIYFKRTLPLKKYGMVPKHSFIQDVTSCTSGLLPENFYDKVEQGSILLKQSETFCFCRNGLILDSEPEVLKSDVVIFATGFNGDKKLKDIMLSPWLRKVMTPSPTSAFPFYREIIHPRIPQLAVIGSSESLSNIFTSEIRCKWLANFLAGRFKLPCVKEMEQNVKEWEKYMKRYSGKYFRRGCVGAIHIWYNDQLCRDMGWNHRRKKSFLAEWFLPYGPSDYLEAEPTSNDKRD